jgi:hypothetical protein
MLKLKRLISDLNENMYLKLVETLKLSGGTKFLLLLDLYKNNNLTDEEITIKLNLSSSAFYTLRSRLYSKISKIITDDLNIEKESILKEYYNLELEFFSLNRNQFTTKLLALEHQLKKFGFNHEIIFIYSLLKRLNTHNNNYYSYSKLYNTHLASFIAVEKANDILCEFNKKIYGFFYCYDDQLKQELNFLVSEIDEYLNINIDNKIIQLIRNVMLIQYYFYIDVSRRGESDKFITDSYLIIETLPNTSFYKTWKPLIDYLKFEQLFHIKNYSDAHKFFTIIESHLNLLLNFNIYSTSTNFLITRLTFIQTVAHYNSFEPLCKIDNKENDFLPQINQFVHEAYLNYYRKQFKESSTIISKLLNHPEISSYKLLQCELKILHAYMNFKLKNYDFTENILLNLIRSINGDKHYKNIHLNYISKTILHISRKSKTELQLNKAKEYFLLYRAIDIPFSILKPIAHEINLNLN